MTARATGWFALRGLAVPALRLAAFAFLYRRSVSARSAAVTAGRLAERLMAENAELLAVSREEALHDALTGLGNRRALIGDLSAPLARAGDAQPQALAIFDLDGFKQYNDTFGHPAGDALLARLAERLEMAVHGLGTAYRMGGDEFCVLATRAGTAAEEIAEVAAAALSETGEMFSIGCSYGIARLPTDASSLDDALRLADQRMYERKAGASSASRQATDALLQVLNECSSELHDHLGDVARLARLLARRLQLPTHEVARIELAAELHDVGKTAIPAALLNKPGKLNNEEWAFMRGHTLIGERIIRAAPSLAHTADLVRSSHERFDGAGYPDKLSGEAIPLGASIIAVCDAYDAMVTDRPYRRAIATAEALAELRRCSGTQFDPVVVEAFCALTEALEAVAQPSV